MTWNVFAPIVARFSSEERVRIRLAYELGESSHAGQKRKSGEPYFIHPVAVASMLADLGADSDTIIAALLHDTVEDTPLTLETILQSFGSDVAGLIDGVTKLEAKDLPKSPTVDAQIETLRKMFTLLQQDVRIMIIKLVDRLHNMRTIEHLSPERAQLLARETVDVYAKIADRLCLQEIRDELEDLGYAVLEPVLNAELRALREHNKQENTHIARDMEETINKDAPAGFSFEALGEQKTWHKLKDQHALGGSAATGISAHTVVFIVKAVDDCYRILGLLHGHWPRETLSFQDFINAPRINGYRGLHTTIILPTGTRVRCKIRTVEMQQYAHKGVATRCFDYKASGVIDYLPWAERISSLSRDTADRSKEFFENLQSDILQESMVIHGPGDETVLVPLHSTALDGAFHLFGEQALKMKRVLLNGREVPFSTPLAYGVTLEIDCEGQTTAERHWLEWAHTGLATAHIRAALGRLSARTRIAEGHRLFQAEMTRHHRGLLEEFEAASLASGVKQLGFQSLNQAYQALADGHIQAEELYQALFPKKSNSTERGELTTIRYSFPPGDMEIVTRLVRLYQAYQEHFQAMSMRYNILSGQVTILLKMMISRERLQTFIEEAKGAGTTNVVVIKSGSSRWTRFGLPFLSVLWGLDCLLGKKLITAGVLPADLTTLRFAVLTLITGGYVLVSLTRHRKKHFVQFKRLSPFNIYLFLSGMGIFVTALSSYVALQYISALAYGLSMNIGIAGILFWEQLGKSGRTPRLVGLTALALIFSSLFLLFRDTGSLLTIGAITGIGCGVGFAIYTATSRRYQLQESVQSRYIVFIFYFAIIAFALSLPFAIKSGFPLWNSPLLLPALAFVLFLNSLPYLIHFELQKYEEVKATWSYIPLFLVVLTAGEYLLYETKSWVLIIPLVLALLWHVNYATDSAAKQS